MRYPPEHKARTRSKILAAAGRLFRRRGYHASGVDAVMREAGLTPGGFYAHFDSKESLLAEALVHSARETGQARERELAGLAGAAWASAFAASYLSPSHRDAEDGGCPLAALISEVAHAGDPVKQQFEAVLLALRGRLAGGDGALDDRWLAVIALCVGGLGLSRSVSDSALGERILEACRTLVLETLDDVS